MHATLPLLEATDFPPIKRGQTETLQVNLGYLCNQSCVHCHVNASPHRTELMSPELIDKVIQVLETRRIGTLDLTGGAPEMNPEFCRLVSAARALGVHVIDRCNLTILMEPGYEGLAAFLADNRVEVVASLPCYSFENVDKQRGKGVFDKSIQALQRLNALGYGQSSEGLQLNLVYNPQGPVLPPDQTSLQADYKRELFDHFGVVFDGLYALANMPINRFGSMLISKGEFERYIALLKQNFSEPNLHSVMCRSLISVDWQGRLYDCDFNQQLGIALAGKTGLSLDDLMHSDTEGLGICVADHCYGCTAGQGSSCGGAL